MTRTVPDAALLLEAISGHDPADPTSARRPVPNFAKLMEGGVRGLRLGVPVEEFWHPVHPGVATRVEQAITLLKEAGAEIERLSLPLLSMSGAVQSVIIHAEATAYHRKHLRTHSAEYSRSVRLRLMEGLFLSADDYVTAQRARHRVRAEMLEALKRVDAFLTPTVPVPAPKLDAEWVEAGEVVAPPQYFMVKNTAVFNLTGLPAVTVPCGETAGLPVGLQIAGRPWDESLILRIARAVEERLPSRRDSTADPSNG
jgi:aspartyl-tRNA(Asn)/glutamyl-tRNA(Gln) amidotransferase subunit A